MKATKISGRIVQVGNSGTEGEGVRDFGGVGVLSFSGGRVGNVGCLVGDGVAVGVAVGVGVGLGVGSGVGVGVGVGDGVGLGVGVGWALGSSQ